MNPNMGAIAVFETDEDAKAAGHTVPLTSAEAKDLFGMNRAERREWARKERNRKKAERKARRGQ